MCSKWASNIWPMWLLRSMLRYAPQGWVLLSSESLLNQKYWNISFALQNMFTQSLLCSLSIPGRGSQHCSGRCIDTENPLSEWHPHHYFWCGCYSSTSRRRLQPIYRCSKLNSLWIYTHVHGGLLWTQEANTCCIALHCCHSMWTSKLSGNVVC